MKKFLLNTSFQTWSWVAQATGLSRPATRRTEHQRHISGVSCDFLSYHVTGVPVGGSPTGTGESPVLPIFRARLLVWGALFSVFFAPNIFAQTSELNIERWKDPSKVIPISLSGFSGTAQEVLKFDLEVHGFELVNGDTAKFFLTGSGGQVQGRLTDANKTQIFSRSYPSANTRAAAHTLANDVIFAITQKKGVTQGTIAFRVGGGNASEIFVSDYDGANAVRVTQDNSLVSAPCWVPGARKLLYMSYKNTFPQVLAHDLGTGARKKFVESNGSHYSPAVSPDGRRVALILNKTGNPELFVADSNGENLQQLTHTREGESSPCWSPDSRTICYVSTTTGRAALYKISADGGAAKRISTVNVGGNLTEPDWSPDGKTIVFTAQMGSFQICTVPAEGGQAITLTEGEDPAWGANSRTIIFTRRKSNGRGLSLLDAPTKRVKDVPRIPGSASQACWAK